MSDNKSKKKGKEDTMKSNNDSLNSDMSKSELLEQLGELKEDLDKKEKKISDLKKELSYKEEDLEQTIDLSKRIKADFENYKKRVKKNQSKLKENLLRDLFSQIIPIIDNLDLSLNFSDSKNFKQGVEMISEQLKTVLSDFGLKKEHISKGDTFNPKKHEAIEVIHTEDNNKDRDIAEVHSHIYLLKGDVFRPAKVKVYRYSENHSDEESGNDSEDKVSGDDLNQGNEKSNDSESDENNK